MTKQEIDLQKIQVLESSYQGWFNLKASLSITLVIGFIILIATVTYENLIDFQTMAFGYLFLFSIMAYVLYDTRKSHDAHIQFVNSLLLKVEKGERLGSLEELRESKGNVLKKKQKTNDNA